MVFPLAAALTAGGSLLGGMFGANAAEKGGKMSAKATLKANKQNIKYQEKFARNAIQWKVRDARRAGIAPLAALGAQTISFSPSSVGATQAGQGVAQGGEIFGQSVARAAAAYGDQDTRNDEYLKALQQLQLTNLNLQNQKIASDIATSTQPGNPPAAPMADANRYLLPGQGQATKTRTDLVETSPLQRTASDPDKLHQEPGALNDVGFVKTNTGFAPVMSKDAKDRYDDDFLGTLSWNARNRIAEPLSQTVSSVPFKAPPGKHWIYSLTRQEYQLEDVPNYGKTKGFPDGTFKY